MSHKKMGCMGDLSYGFIREKYEHTYMFIQAGAHIHFHWGIIVILTWNPNVSMFVDTDEAPKLERQYDETLVFVVVSMQWLLWQYY